MLASPSLNPSLETPSAFSMSLDRSTPSAKYVGCSFVFVQLTTQAFGLIVRRINDEPYDVASVPGSRAVTIKFIIPNSRMGSV
jgi:hypothetical protein